MGFLRFSGLVIALSMLSVAPSDAAVTYTWPVMLAQPISLTNIEVPQGGSVQLYCYAGGRGVTAPVAVSRTQLAVSADPGGGVSYQGKLIVSVFSSSTECGGTTRRRRFHL